MSAGSSEILEPIYQIMWHHIKNNAILTVEEDEQYKVEVKEKIVTMK
jgi:hypothetical protein